MATLLPPRLRGESSTGGAISDVVLQCVFNHLNDPQDRRSASEVCPQWHRIDGLTRKHVEIRFCYTISPSALTRRFNFLDSLKIKGRPRAAEFDLLPCNWGGYAKPWVDELARAYRAMSKLHFKRMHVSDEDLEKLARRFAKSLEVLKLDKCDGCSSLGLLQIARLCRNIKVIYLEESDIEDKGGEWLRELARHNPQLESLNFALTPLEVADIRDLEMLVENCRGLTCLKVSEIDPVSMKGVLNRATALQEFALTNASFVDEHADQHDFPEAQDESFSLPRNLNALSGDIDIVLPLNPVAAANIKKLDLKLTCLSPEDQIELLRCCVNLEALEMLNNVGDAGLSVLVNNCKKLRRLRIERADDPPTVSPNSLVSLAQSCVHLKFLALHVPNVSNGALRAIGQYCQQLHDFRLILIEGNATATELPLDEGMLAVMRDCKKLIRICIYLIDGGLTDIGMKHIGNYGGNLKWALLGCVGDSDAGLLDFAAGCQKLEKLEMRACPFSEAALCEAVITMTSLKYIWVEGCLSRERSDDFRCMRRPHWNMEFCGSSQPLELFKQILAYYSLAGERRDMPEHVISLCHT